MARNKYMQDPGRGNDPMNTPLAMHGPLHKKGKGKRIGIHGYDYKEYGLSDYAKEHVHKVKPANFFRSQEKTIVKVPKSELHSTKSKLTNEPTKNWAPSTNYKDHKENKGFKEVDSYDEATHYTGGAPTAGELRKSNIKEKVNLGLTGLAGGIGWHLVNTMGQGR
jgi:hypothetical protein